MPQRAAGDGVDGAADGLLVGAAVAHREADDGAPAPGGRRRPHRALGAQPLPQRDRVGVVPRGEAHLREDDVVEHLEPGMLRKPSARPVAASDEPVDEVRDAATPRDRNAAHTGTPRARRDISGT